MTQLIATSQWTFYGTGNAQPTLELFTGQLRDLGCTFRAREKVTKNGVLMGLEVVPPTRPLLSVAVHLSIPGVGGEVTIDFLSLSPRDRKAYRKIQLPDKSPASDLTTLAAITAIDRHTGRTYRNLVSPSIGGPYRSACSRRSTEYLCRAESGPEGGLLVGA